MLAITCRLCGSAEVRFLFQKHSIPHWECERCRLCFSSPDANINLTNTLEDFEACYLQYLEPSLDDLANFNSMLNWMQRFCNPHGSKLLDVGCGSGKFVRYLRHQGIEASGIEPSEALHNHFLASDSSFECATPEAVADSRRGRYDIITAFDVLEHVESPLSFIQSLAKMLAPDGVMLLSTPDRKSPSARLMGRFWHFYNPYHLGLFSAETISVVCEQCDLDRHHFSRRGRRRSVGYILQYGWELVLRRQPPRWFERLNGTSIPINLFDTMYVCLKHGSQQGSQHGSRDGAAFPVNG